MLTNWGQCGETPQSTLSSNMWEPDYIPSREELVLGVESMKKLDQRLHAAQEQLRIAQATVATLEEERKLKSSWLAPIRRVPSDILSLWFIETCSIEWMAPLVLGAVCRRWREVLLATPRAWAFLKMTPKTELLPPGLLDLWMSRCGAIGCHFSLPRSAPPAIVDVICKHGSNIACLSLFGNATALKGHFPLLKELRIGGQPWERAFGSFSIGDEETGGPPQSNGEEEASLLDVIRFPRLQNVHLHEPATSTIMRIALRSGFPPLQELHIYIDSSHCLDIIEFCADSLVKLSVKFVAVPKDTRLITLPRLKRFSFQIHLSYWDSPRPQSNFLTPVLESYCEFHSVGLWPSPLHEDTSSVKFLHIQSPGSVEWSRFPNLSHLSLQRDLHMILKDCEYLENQPSKCPQLIDIKMNAPTGWDSTIQSIQSQIQKAIFNRNRLTDATIRCHDINNQDMDKLECCNNFQVPIFRELHEV